MGRDTKQARNSADHPPSGRGATPAAERALRAHAVALEHFGNGRLAEAQAACHEALSGQPEHFDSLHLQGVILAQRGSLDDAAQSIRRALDLNPDSADAHNSLGIVFRWQGKSKQALGCYDAALAIRPSYVDALNNRGAVLRALRQFDEAVESYEGALKLAPDNLDARVALGRALLGAERVEEAITAFQRAASLTPRSAEAHLRLGQALRVGRHFEAAEESLRRAVDLDPEDATAWNELGHVQRELRKPEEAIYFHKKSLRLRGDWAPGHEGLGLALKANGALAEAETSLRHAAKLAPDQAGIQSNLGNVQVQCGDLDGATKSYERALEIDPDFSNAYSNLSIVLLKQDRIEDAVGAASRAVALEPGYPEAHNNLGMAYCAQGKISEAIECYETAVRISPEFAKAHCNLGNMRLANRDHDGALRCYRRASEIDPDFELAYWNEALVLLLQGDFKEGWAKYEYRLSTEDFASHRKLEETDWDGSELDGRTILIHAEQGFGDTLQFCRYAPLVKAKGGRVVLECQPALKRLLGSLDGADAVVAHGEKLPEFDLQAPLPGLPHRLGTTLDDVPASVPYVFAPPDAAERWREKLSGATGLKVGVVWHGASRPNRRRSIPADVFKGILDTENVSFFGLAREERPEDHKIFGRQHADFRNLGPDLTDFAETAGAVQALDLVITVDTAIAHLAGAMSKPVWTLLPFVADWRWMLDRTDSPWYPTMRLFRQRVRGDWPAVIETVRVELGRIAAGTSDSFKDREIGVTAKQAIGLYEVGDKEAAERACRAVLASEPNNPDTLHLLGVLIYQKGKQDEGEQLFRKAISENPSFAEAHNSLGIALRQRDQLEEAVACYERAISVEPDYAEAYDNMGLAFMGLKRVAQAVACHDRAQSIRPDFVSANRNLAIALKAQGRTEEAIERLTLVSEATPNSHEAHMELAAALLAARRYDAAGESYEAALSLRPDDPKSRRGKGTALWRQNKLTEARTAFEGALKIDPSYADAHVGLGNTLGALGKYEEALASYRSATAAAPANAAARWNEGLVLLLLGRFKDGWEKYEWRWRVEEVAAHVRDFEQPLWDGSDLGERTILLHAEQGFGDAIQFCRYVALVAERGGHLILEVPAQLTSLMAGLPEVEQVVGKGAALPDFDCHAPLLSLPRIFEADLANFPANVPYLKVPADRHGAEKLRGARGLNVGVVWFGSAKHGNDGNRSIPAKEFAPLLDMPSVNFYGLSTEARPEDAEVMAGAGAPFTSLGASFSDFSDTAAAIEALDLVITVDTAVAHLAGALGKPTWLLLPFTPDWRWMLNRDDSPWYPTMRLFRQTRPGDWKEVVATVKSELAASLNDRTIGGAAIWPPKDRIERLSTSGATTHAQEKFFAQHGQDKYLEEKIFKGKTKGTFVDIGGHDGLMGSNTLFFERSRGWNGLCIEPAQSQYEKLVKNRRVECINVALADFEGEAEFLEVTKGLHQMGGLTDELRPNVREMIAEAEGSESQVVRVPVTTFKKIAAERDLRNVDYCSIDVEGAEIRVLNGIDFEFTDISVISIENPPGVGENFDRIRRYLESHGYRLMITIGADDIFVRE